jgi:hypothetical protein
MARKKLARHTAKYVPQRKVRTHCKQGHPYTPENTLVVQNGKSRKCRACTRIHNRRSFERRQESASIANRKPCIFCGKMIGQVICSECRAKVPRGKKVCTICRKVLLSSRINKQRARVASGQCKDCVALSSVHKRFGLAPAEYLVLLGKQDGRCGICRNKPRTRRLAVDHDHKTGMIRGLLCSRCNNRLLGAANDSIERLQHAIDYLTSPPGLELGRIIDADKLAAGKKRRNQSRRR